MIELQEDTLVLSFPEVHPLAEIGIGFQRTLRIPDDGREYPLPPGLGMFPLRHVGEFEGRVPGQWLANGGVMLPIHQSEALWIHFSSYYPFAVRVATGGVDAVTGEVWSEGLSRSPQNYLSVPTQPWLDGFCVGKGLIRQFVAMPPGTGYTAEEQVTGKAEHGGLQISVVPLTAWAWNRMMLKNRLRGWMEKLNPRNHGRNAPRYCRGLYGLGVAAGGHMRQDIYADPFRLADWHRSARSNCFVHLADAGAWRGITGEDCPTMPPPAARYAAAGLPWFEYASPAPPVDGSATLASLASVAEIGAERGEDPLPENESADPLHVVWLDEETRMAQTGSGEL
jgi:hypothetical protein